MIHLVSRAHNSGGGCWSASLSSHPHSSTGIPVSTFSKIMKQEPKENLPTAQETSNDVSWACLPCLLIVSPSAPVVSCSVVSCCPVVLLFPLMFSIHRLFSFPRFSPCCCPPMLSTSNPPCEQGLATVVTGAGHWSHPVSSSSHVVIIPCHHRSVPLLLSIVRIST